MDADKICKYLTDYGQHDKKFKLGELIKYTPIEIRDILKNMPDDNEGEKKVYDKPPIGAAPYHMNAGLRVRELSNAILRYEEGGFMKYADNIMLLAEEIVEQCRFVGRMKDEEEYINGR